MKLLKKLKNFDILDRWEPQKGETYYLVNDSFEVSEKDYDRDFTDVFCKMVNKGDTMNTIDLIKITQQIIDGLQKENKTSSLIDNIEIDSITEDSIQLSCSQVLIADRNFYYSLSIDYDPDEDDFDICIQFKTWLHYDDDIKVSQSYHRSLDSLISGCVEKTIYWYDIALKAVDNR